MSSCVLSDSEPFNGNDFDGTAYRPIYATADELTKVSVTAPVSLTDPGKIYVSDNYLFINDRGRGVHIIDNKDPKKPVNLSFISILSNYDIAAKGNWLYADNATDLLVFDISDPRVPKLIKRITNAIPVSYFPPYQNIFFECADEKKGVVIKWEKVTLDKQPNCFR
ncbi:hypothetical protein E0F88_04940 [Dyadobacter psychrotolerans]|uniref:LVIVD repeat-containing protein n=2 Tax=Dyadobacter psychrotolerans TaxID=2541721 RepID=A0A4V2Z4S5_9BACT|nr:hypothetical protein E0F88_04940 [Dyadobacter psychrotolerans]